MKNTLLITLLIASLCQFSGFSTTTPIVAENSSSQVETNLTFLSALSVAHNRYLDALLGEWAGTFYNVGGIGGVRFTIFRSGAEYRATITHFYHRGQNPEQFASGTRSAYVEFDVATGDIHIIEDGWIELPYCGTTPATEYKTWTIMSQSNTHLTGYWFREWWPTLSFAPQLQSYSFSLARTGNTPSVASLRPTQIASLGDRQNLNSQNINEYPQMTIVAIVQPLSGRRAFTPVFYFFDESMHRHLSPHQMRGIGLARNGWAVTNGRGSEYTTIREDVFTANTYFLAVAYDNVNREVRFVIDDTVHRTRGFFNPHGQLPLGELRLNTNAFHIVDFVVFTEILPLYELERLRGAPITDNVERYAIDDRFSYITAQDYDREAMINSAFVYGAEFIITGRDIIAYSMRVGGSTHFVVGSGGSLFLTETPELTTWQHHGRERIQVRNLAGSVGYVAFEQLRFNALAEGHDYIRPRLVDGEVLREFVVARTILGVSWWVLLLVFIVVIAVIVGFSYLHTTNRSDDVDEEGVHIPTMIPGIILAIGLLIVFIGGIFQGPNIGSVVMEARWFFSYLRLLPIGLSSSFVSWALYFTVSITVISIPLSILLGTRAFPAKDGKQALAFLGMTGLTFGYTVIIVILAAIVAALLVALVVVAVVAIIVIVALVLFSVFGVAQAGSNPWRDNNGRRLG